MSVRNEGVSSVRQQMRRVPQPLVDMGLALMVAVSVIIAIGLSPIPGRPPDALAYVLGSRSPRWCWSQAARNRRALDLATWSGRSRSDCSSTSSRPRSRPASNRPRRDRRRLPGRHRAVRRRRRLHPPQRADRPEQVVEVLNDLFRQRLHGRRRAARATSRPRRGGGRDGLAMLEEGGGGALRPERPAPSGSHWHRHRPGGGRCDRDKQVQLRPVGDTVNMASRMESHGVPGCIQVTDRAYRRLRDRYRFQRRGPRPCRRVPLTAARVAVPSCQRTGHGRRSVTLPGGEPGTREEPLAHHSRGGNFGAPEQGPGQPSEPDQPDEPGQGSKSGRGEPGGQGQRGAEQASRH
jgi:hypothetical protein